MACFACMPDCDKCIPKFIHCPECGVKGKLADADCNSCGHAFTSEERQKAKALWIKELLSKRTRD